MAKRPLTAEQVRMRYLKMSKTKVPFHQECFKAWSKNQAKAIRRVHERDRAGKAETNTVAK